MVKQNNGLNQINLVVHVSVSLTIQRDREVNTETQDDAMVDARITAVEESIDCLERRFRHFEYLNARNEELENRDNPYSSDGDANCNS